MPTDLNLFTDIFPVFYLIFFMWAGFVLVMFVSGNTERHTWRGTLLAALATFASATGWITTWPGDRLNQYVLAPVADAFSYVWMQCAEHPFHTVAMAIIAVFVVWRVRQRYGASDWLDNADKDDIAPARPATRDDDPATEEINLTGRPQLGAGT